jgi:hypothetical protein
MISDEVGVVSAMSEGRLPATAKLATRLNIMSAWAGSETEAARAAVQAKSAEWRGTAASPVRMEAAMLWASDISVR